MGLPCYASRTGISTGQSTVISDAPGSLISGTRMISGAESGGLEGCPPGVRIGMGTLLSAISYGYYVERSEKYVRLER